MAILKLTPEARDAVASVSFHDNRFPTFVNDQPEADGLILWDVDDEIAGRLNDIRFPGETDSDVLIRLAHFYTGKKAN